jgi:hypothetical protein
MKYGEFLNELTDYQHVCSAHFPILCYMFCLPHPLGVCNNLGNIG